MRNLNILILIFAFTALGCKAQHIIPVEKVVDYRDSEEGLMGNKDYVYVKDINNLLQRFVGNWKGNYNSKKYEFKINKITEDDGELKKDMLLVRYKIKDVNGNILANTLNLPNNSIYVIKGSYLAKSGGYVLLYQGLEAECGQNGDLYISTYGTNDTKLQLSLEPYGEIDPESCNNRAVKQILPTKKSMELIKQ